MPRKISHIAFTVLFLTLSLWNTISYAEDNQATENAITRLNNAMTAGQTEYDNLQNLNSVMNDLVGRWSENRQLIENGISVTITDVFANATAVIPQGGTIPIAAISVFMTKVDALDLAIERDSLYLPSMELAIIKTKDSKDKLETLIDVYNHTFTHDYLVVLNTHLAEEIPHPHISPSEHKHDLITIKTWTKIPVSIPEFTCNGPCWDTFNTPTEAYTAHLEVCGTIDGVDLETTGAHTLSAIFVGLFPPEAFDALFVSERTVDQGCGHYY